MTAQALGRKAFTISRLAELTSVAELERQTGHPVARWPAVVIKELVDNALDAAEDAEATPDVAIEVKGSTFVVEDAGPGIAPDVVARLADFASRTSSRAAYVSPTRGAQGNALQTIVAMGFALDPANPGQTIIESRGVKHRIVFTADPVRRTPVVERTQGPSTIKTGVRITVEWPNSASSIVAAAKAEILSLADGFVRTNPHAAFRRKLFGGEILARPSAEGWRKWRPSDPASAHWHTEESLSKLIGATIAHAEDAAEAVPSVRDFVRDFRGLSSTVKAAAVCAAIDAGGVNLANFYARGRPAVVSLLAAMRGESRPVEPVALGVLGRSRVAAALEQAHGDLASVQYRKAAFFGRDGLPYVVETAFALQAGMGARDVPGPSEDSDIRAMFIEGANFTPAIGGSPFRLESMLGGQFVVEDDPVIIFAHVTCPSFAYLDRGKSRVSLPDDVAARLKELVAAVTKGWQRQRKAEMRGRAAYWNRRERLARRHRPASVKEAAYAAMHEAYMAASAGGTLPANARQIYYAARPAILEATRKEALDSAYFTQTLLVGYMAKHPVECASWDVAFDARGAFVEPHGGESIDLGTIEVREYLARIRAPKVEPAAIKSAHVSTIGPAGRFGAVLFLEKEGFDPILSAVGVAERFDISVMSTKGMSVTAARKLVDQLAAHGVRLFVLHDFDIAGFSIRKTLTESGPRYAFANRLDFVDLGLRLEDVRRLGLQSERVTIDWKSENAKRDRLEVNGATEAEIDFLLSGQRVELNAMTSRQFVDFIEAGLRRHEVRKVIPATAVIEEAFAALTRGRKAEERFTAEIERLNEEPVEAPPDLERRVREYLTEHPEDAWHEAIETIVDEEEA